jgi:hypothetical protein
VNQLIEQAKNAQSRAGHTTREMSRYKFFVKLEKGKRYAVPHCILLLSLDAAFRSFTMRSGTLVAKTITLMSTLTDFELFDPELRAILTLKCAS